MRAHARAGARLATLAGGKGHLNVNGVGRIGKSTATTSHRCKGERCGGCVFQVKATTKRPKHFWGSQGSQYCGMCVGGTNCQGCA